MPNLFENAYWIGSPHPFDLHEVYLDFLAPPVTAKGEKIELLISADARYRLWLNGQFVARGPVRSHPHAQGYDRIDLSPVWKRNGKNKIAVQVYQPGYSHFSYLHRGAAALLAELSIDGNPLLVSDSTWQVRRNQSFVQYVPRVSIYGAGIEIRNLELEENWQGSRYRPKEEEWGAARVVAGPEGPIWYGLHERLTPLSVESELEAALIECRLCYDDYDFGDTHEAVSMAWEYGDRFDDFPIDRDGWISPVLEYGDSALFLYDLGRAYTCQGWVEVRDANGSEVINMTYAEKMRDGKLVISDPQTYCRVRPTDSFALGTGNQTVEPFHMRGGRYLLFQLSGECDGEFSFRPRVRVAEYPLEITKTLKTADPQLNRIIKMCETTFKACLQDSFVDCVWRESSQWVGDGLIQAKIMGSMTDDLRPVRKLLLDAARGQYPDGLLPSVAPAEVHAYTIPRYTSMWIELLAFYLQQTQDETLLSEIGYETFVRAVEAQLRQRHPTGLIVTPPGRRHYIDWSATAQANPHLVTNLHLVLGLQKACQLITQPDGQARSPFSSLSETDWLTEATALKRLCRTHFFHDGVWWDDIERTTYSQLGAALAILTESFEATATLEPVIEEMIARSLDLRDEHKPGEMVLASPYMHHYIFLALERASRQDAILEIIKTRWGRWADQGVPTTWENWNVDFPDGSQCHAYSAHPRYHLSRIYD